MKNDQFEMFKIPDANLKKGALEDIVELLAKKPKNNGEYITHMTSMMIDYTVKYIQKKFCVSDKEVEDYLEWKKK